MARKKQDRLRLWVTLDQQTETFKLPPLYAVWVGTQPPVLDGETGQYMEREDPECVIVGTHSGAFPVDVELRYGECKPLAAKEEKT